MILNIKKMRLLNERVRVLQHLHYNLTLSFIKGSLPFKKKDYFQGLFMYFVYISVLPARTPAYYKRALDPSTDDCEPLCGRWKLNSGRLEEQGSH